MTTRAGTVAALWAAVVLTAVTGVCCAADVVPLRRAFVPADRTEAWPAGAWERIPYRQFREFERSREGDSANLPPAPVIERLVLRGTLIEPSVIAGQFVADVRRLDDGNEFLELGAITPAVRELNWSNGPAVWGTAPDGSALVYVDRADDQLAGKWSLRGEPVFDDLELNLRMFPAAAIRLELTLPAGRALECSRGIVSAADGAVDGVVTWVVELGQSAECLCRVVSSETRSHTAPSYEGITSYTIRPDGGRLQADFNISVASPGQSQLRFVIPPGVENVEATTAANVGLPADIEVRDEVTTLVVPLPEGANGRLGTIRIGGDLTLREDGIWELPVVRLQDALQFSGIRRVHVERPLTLLSFDVSEMRQTGIAQEDRSGTWTFEDLSTDASLRVQIGRPPARLSLRALTLIEFTQSEAQFRSVVRLLSRGESIYRAELRFPATWTVVDVGVPPGEVPAVTAWRVVDGDTESILEIDFRQALSSQTPRQVLISGRCVESNPGARPIQPFPKLGADDEARVMLAVRGTTVAGSDLIPHGGLRALADGENPPEWAPLAAALGVTVGDPQSVWFVETGAGAAGSVSVTSARGSAAPAETPTPGGAESAFTSDGPLQLDLSLESNIGSRGTAWHRHVAVFHLSGKRPEAPPKIKLPSDIQVDGVFVDGRPQSVVAADGTIEVLDWPASPDRLEIRYRSRVADEAGWLSRALQIPLPEWETTPRELRWQLHLPRTERITELDVPQSTMTPRLQGDWTQRLFGPLARENWTAGIFPFSAADDSQRSALTGGGDAVTVAVFAPGPVMNLELAEISNGQRAAWFCMLGACLAVCVLKLRAKRGLLLSGCAATAMCLAAATLPEPQSMLWGGALMGTLLGILLPASWLSTRSAGALRVDGSSLRHAGAAAGVAVLLACLLASTLPAQSPSAGAPPPSPTVSETTPEFDVLIPMQGDAQTDEVWIQRRLLPAFEAWRGSQQRHPQWLLQSARYEFQPGSTPRLYAEFDVVVFDRRPQVMLALPFRRLWVSDPDACRVNDEPAQIRPAADSGSLLVALPGAAADAEQIETVRVALELQPSAASQVGSGWEFDVPAVLDSILKLPAAGESETELSARSQRDPESDAAGRRVFELEASSVISVQPAAEPTPSSSPRWSFDAMSLIEVHPLHLRVRTQLTTVTAPQSAGVAGSQWLRLLLPGQAEVPVVAVEGLRSYAVRSPRPGTTLLELELDRRLPAEKAVHLDFTLPTQKSGTQVVIPALEFLEAGQLRSHRIGLRAAPGMNLEPPAATDLSGDLREMPIAVMFSAGLSNNSTWPVPSHVYLASRPTPIPVGVLALDVVRSASLEQSLNVGDGMLQWQATAVVDVPVLPAFKHEFVLAPEVRLDAVDVQQEGASRLVNWARHDDRLVLYLSGDRTGRQEVRLSGVMPFQVGATTPLPAFSLLDAAITASELIVQSPQARRLDLIAADGAELSSGTATATEAGFIRRFSQQDAVLPTAFRSEAAPAQLSVAVVTRVDQRGAEWRWNTEFHLDRPLNEGEFLIVGMPRELAGSMTPNRLTLTTPDGEAGDVLRLLLHAPADSAETNLGFSTQLTIPAQGDYIAPRIELLNARVSDQIVIVPDEFPFGPATASASVVEPASWPLELREQESLAEAEAAFRFVDGEARFTPRQANAGTPVVKFIESAIWPAADGSIAGATTFWVVVAESRCELQVPWPGAVTLHRALWDDRLLEASSGADELVRFREAGLVPGSVHRLHLEWSTAAAFTTSGGEVWRPHWTQTPAAPEIAAVFARDGYRLSPRGATRGRLDALQQRAAAMLGLYEAASVDDRRRLATEVEFAVSALEKYSVTTGKSSVARWNVLQASPTAPQSPPDASDFRTPSLIATAVADDQTLLVSVPAGAASIDVRELHSGSTLAAVVIAVLLALVLLARFRQVWSRAVARLPVNQDAVNVALLGGIWWLWLQVSVVGLALLMVAAVLQWRSVRRPSLPSAV